MPILVFGYSDKHLSEYRGFTEILRNAEYVEKIPSEMEVAPPHKRFTQFSALIKL